MAASSTAHRTLDGARLKSRANCNGAHQNEAHRSWSPHRPQLGWARLAELASLVATGKITPVIERAYPLGETASAIRRIEAEHARGKYVLTL